MNARIERSGATHSTPIGTTLRAALIAGLALLLAACDASLLADAPATLCSEAGEQCQLPTGPLGVCERTQCPAGEDSVCFECISQH